MKKRKDGYYAAQIYLGVVEGKRKYKTVYGKSPKEVNNKAAEIRNKIGKGIRLTSENDTLGYWMGLFLSDKKAEGVSSSHYKNLDLFCRYLSSLHDTPLRKVTSADIQQVINFLSGVHDGKMPLSKRTLTGIKQAVGQTYKKAIGARIVDYNPADYVTIPKGASETHREAIPESQQKWISETPHRAQRAAMIMLYAGLRRGEVLALTWADVDFNNKTIKVSRAVRFDNDRPCIKSPKTAAGIRTVNIPDNLVQFLLNEKKKDDCIYIMHTTDGRLLSQSAWKSIWDSYMRDLNVKYGYVGSVSKHNPNGLEMNIHRFTPHQLRHTYATLLYMAGVDALTVIDQLGHSDIKTALGVYTHPDDAYKKSSMEQFNNYICKYDASIKA